MRHITRLLRRGRRDADYARELESYLAIETDENIARGMTPADARDAARRKLGNVTRIREEDYQRNTVAWLDAAARDLRLGWRLLRREPAFAVVAILSLALGVGANTAIFELLNAVRMRPLPVSQPDQLAEIRIAGDGDSMSGGFDGHRPNLTFALWQQIAARQEGFSSLFAWGSTNFELSSGGPSRTAEGLWVSGDFFSTLGVHALVGRVLVASDDRRGCGAPAVMISYGFWQREYGGSPAAVGRSLTLDGHAYDVVGVTPPEFFGVEVGHSFDVAAPLCAEPLSLPGTRSHLERRDNWFLAAIGRLRPGWSIARAGAQLSAISPAVFRDTLPKYRPEDERAYLAFRLGAFPAATGVSSLRTEYERPLWLLFATTAVVLLIACANLANLMLARATVREREVAVRLALGASRGRIVRQLVTESALIAACGAAAGAVVAQWLSRALVASLKTTSNPVFVAVVRDWRVFVFVAVVASTACVLFGVLPALRATQTSPGTAMHAGGRTLTDSRERFSVRRALVVTQVALSLVLVVGALLFVRTFRNLTSVDAGLRPERLVIARFDLRRAGVPLDRLTALYRDVLDRARHSSGIENAAEVRNVPISGSFSNRDIIVDGVKRTEHTNFNSITDRYFATMGTPVLAGRDFDNRDTDAAPRVAIVSESFARVYFAGRNPIDRTFQIAERPGEPQPAYTIVGLVRDSVYDDLRAVAHPLMFVPAAQDPQQPLVVMRLVVRSPLPVATITATIAAMVREVNPALVVSFGTMETQFADSIVRERLMATLSAFFGALAAVIAAIGLYGVLSYMIARRRGEIGIRMALGADRRQVLALVLREAAGLVAVGVVVGVCASLGAARLASALLFGLTPNDPITLVVAVVTLTATASVASYLPAARVARLQPTEALRQE